VGRCGLIIRVEPVLAGPLETAYTGRHSLAPTQNLTTQNLIDLAQAFDQEGKIWPSRNKKRGDSYSLHAGIYQDDHELLLWALLTFKGYLAWSDSRERWYWKTRDDRARVFLKAAYPHLENQSDEAENALEVSPRVLWCIERGIDPDDPNGELSIPKMAASMRPPSLSRRILQQLALRDCTATELSVILEKPDGTVRARLDPLRKKGMVETIPLPLGDPRLLSKGKDPKAFRITERGRVEAAKDEVVDGQGGASSDVTDTAEGE
jgi:DNA-binding transcriptional ArsR family regulator